jgi:hypothetical protein
MAEEEWNINEPDKEADLEEKMQYKKPNMGKWGYFATGMLTGSIISLMSGSLGTCSAVWYSSLALIGQQTAMDEPRELKDRISIALPYFAGAIAGQLIWHMVLG